MTMNGNENSLFNIDINNAVILFSYLYLHVLIIYFFKLFYVVIV